MCMMNSKNFFTKINNFNTIVHELLEIASDNEINKRKDKKKKKIGNTLNSDKFFTWVKNIDLEVVQTQNTQATNRSILRHIINLLKPRKMKRKS